MIINAIKITNLNEDIFNFGSYKLIIPIRERNYKDKLGNIIPMIFGEVEQIEILNEKIEIKARIPINKSILKVKELVHYTEMFCEEINRSIDQMAIGKCEIVFESK